MPDHPSSVGVHKGSLSRLNVTVQDSLLQVIQSHTIALSDALWRSGSSGGVENVHWVVHGQLNNPLVLRDAVDVLMFGKNVGVLNTSLKRKS